MSLKAIVVDDEPLAREGVAMALAEEGDVEVVAMCADGSSAIAAIRRLQPDLVLLDIKMPGLSGFDVIAAIGEDVMPAVVFLTAYEEHALRAFRVNAIDYLLKPLDGAELRVSVERVRRRIAANERAGQGRQLRAVLTSLGVTTGTDSERLVVRAAGRVHFVAPEQIDWVEAAGDYVTIHAAGRDHLIRESMHAMAQRLIGHGFQRIHRSAIVNLQKVRELATGANGDHTVVLHDGTTLRLSRTYREALYRALKAD
jgi:two-component system LytT family response regulator